MVKITRGLLWATILAAVSASFVPDHHGIILSKKEKIKGFTQSITEKKGKKWNLLNWWNKGSEDEHSVPVESHPSPIWKIHKYKGIEVKPIYTVYQQPDIKEHIYPPTNVQIHSPQPVGLHYERPVSVQHIAHPSPSPVYKPETNNAWETDDAWKWSSGNEWSVPLTQEHQTVHVQETPTSLYSLKKKFKPLHSIKSSWKSKWNFKLPKIEKVEDKGSVIAYGELPEVPEIQVPGFEEMSLPEISHIHMAVPIHQKTTTIIEHEAPKKVYKPAYEEQHHEYSQYQDTHVQPATLYNSYGEALPSDAYGQGSQKIEIIAPPPALRVQGNIPEQYVESQDDNEEIEYPQHNYKMTETFRQHLQNSTAQIFQPSDQLQQQQEPQQELQNQRSEIEEEELQD